MPSNTSYKEGGKMKRRILIGGTALLIAVLLASSCGGGVSQEDYDEVQRELATTQATLSQTGSELDALRTICPPGDFVTVTELEDWAEDHLQRDTTFVTEAFRAALKVQDAGAEDGYLISVNVESDVDTDTYYISCLAIAGGDAYWWFPEESTYMGAWATYLSR
jgi:hypothetical protein